MGINVSGALTGLASVLLAIGLFGGAVLAVIAALASWQWARAAVGIGPVTPMVLPPPPWADDDLGPAPPDRGLDEDWYPPEDDGLQEEWYPPEGAVLLHRGNR